MSDEVKDALDALRQQLAKVTETELVWGDDGGIQPQVLPSGLRQIDEAMNGGVAFRRMSLFVGEQSAGKTLLAMAFMKAAQAAGKPVVFIDVERTWTADWAQHVGLDPSRVLVSLPPNGEKAFDVLRGVVKTLPAGLVVLDSIAAMPPAAELEAETEQQFIGTQARMVNKALRTLNADNVGGWAIVLINQIREKVGVVYGNPETLPGGKGQNYYAWQIVRVRRGAPIEEGTGKDKRLVGRVMRIRLDKNKQGAPGATAEIPFYFTGQFDELSGLIDHGIELDVIESKGGYYTFNGVKTHGMRALRERFEDADELAALEVAIAAAPSDDGVDF